MTDQRLPRTWYYIAISIPLLPLKAVAMPRVTMSVVSDCHISNRMHERVVAGANSKHGL